MLSHLLLVSTYFAILLSHLIGALSKAIHPRKAEISVCYLSGQLVSLDLLLSC